MEEINLEIKNTTSTQVTVSANSIVERAYLYSGEVPFKYDRHTDKIHFPCNEELNDLHLNVAKLSSAALSTLSLTTASTNKDLFDALVTGKFFEGK